MAGSSSTTAMRRVMALQYTGVCHSIPDPAAIAMISPLFFATLPLGLPRVAPRRVCNDGAPIRPNLGKGRHCMNKLDSNRAVAVDDHVWRDLAGLGVEALAIGLA